MKPYVGMPVVVRMNDKVNGTRLAPGLVAQVFSDTVVNIVAFPLAARNSQNLLAVSMFYSVSYSAERGEDGPYGWYEAAEPVAAPVPVPDEPQPDPEPQPEPDPAPSADYVFVPTGLSGWGYKQVVGSGNVVSELLDGWVRCHAPTYTAINSGATAKAGVENKRIQPIEQGDTVVIEAVIAFKPSASYENIFLLDLETADERSTGTRLRLNANGSIRLDGGKLGFKSRNSDDGSTKPITGAKRARFEVFAHPTSGSVVVHADGERIAIFENVPTMPGGGALGKVQFGLTANSSPGPQTMDFKDFELRLYKA